MNSVQLNLGGSRLSKAKTNAFKFCVARGMDWSSLWDKSIQGLQAFLS